MRQRIDHLLEGHGWTPEVFVVFLQGAGAERLDHLLNKWHSNDHSEYGIGYTYQRMHLVHHRSEGWPA